MKKEDIEEIRKIYETQVANGKTVIQLNMRMFKELLEHAEKYNSVVKDGGRLQIGREWE